jgi:uncharacterized membrane protein
MGMNPLNKLGMWLEALVVAIIARIPAFLVGGYAFVPLPGMFLPVRMSESPTLRSGIRDYVYLIIGLFIVTLVGGILYYILDQMNSSNVTIPRTVNVLQYVFSFNGIIGLLFAMVIVIIAIVLIIRYLRGAQEGWE